ncbi:MAG TPA: tetratricopeptide repeat protein, partial [Allosphingosinicella sp.]|nr:tetratricopeptide repeat protein [Allosphingosinicella sp.]
ATSRTRPRTSTGSFRKAEEAPITPICKRLAAAALGGALLLSAAPAAATVDDERALAAYVRARAADSLGRSQEAASAYAAALAASPDNGVLATRTLSQAVAAGDRLLALKAALALEAKGKLQPDARLLLLGEAFRTRRWKEAERQIAEIEKDDVFSFMTPLLRAWLAQGSGKGDPLALLAKSSGNALASTYAGEHRPLLLLAAGKAKEGALALASLLEDVSIRAQRLRIAAAAALARKGEKQAALELLRGEGEAVGEARARLEAGKRPGLEIATPAAGLAELVARIALDLDAQQIPQLALAFARLSTFIEPANPEGHLIAAELLAERDRPDEALAALARVPASDPFAAMAADRRVSLLVEAKRGPEALAEAREAARLQPGSIESWTRLGDVLGELDRQAEAAEAYGRALDLARGADAPGHPLWTLWMLRGSALTQAGRWPEGKAALEQAHKLAPDQPVVLNYLGYSQLERRENVAAAEALIREAARLQPDNAAITDSLGWAHYVRGDLKSAVALLEQAARGLPTDPSIGEHLGDAYYAAGRRYEARYAWQAALVYADAKAAERLRAKIDVGLRPELAAP